MVKHVVFFRLKEYSEENCDKLIAHFLTMRENVPVAKQVNAYKDFGRIERAYDVMLEVLLDSKEDLHHYEHVDKYHCETIRGYVRSVVSSSASVDCFI